jgi:hypothetical protein
VIARAGYSPGWMRRVDWKIPALWAGLQAANLEIKNRRESRRFFAFVYNSRFQQEFGFELLQIVNKANLMVASIIGRDERIRTSDPSVPNAVLYQAEPRPDSNIIVRPKRILMPSQRFSDGCSTTIVNQLFATLTGQRVFAMPTILIPEKKIFRKRKSLPEYQAILDERGAI